MPFGNDTKVYKDNTEAMVILNIKQYNTRCFNISGNTYKRRILASVGVCYVAIGFHH